MIRLLKLKNFKLFKDYEIRFDKIQLLIGGNNSGKTSIFHALQIFFWCIEQTLDLTGQNVILKKTQLPEIGAIPYFNAKDLFYLQKTRSGGSPTRIQIELHTSVAPEINFDIYPAFSRNLMIDGKNTHLTMQQYKKLLKLKPIYIPSTIGITVQEELYREIAQHRLISEGRHNQVMRNMIFRLSKTRYWDQFKTIIEPLFDLDDLDVPFNEDLDEWLTAVYKEGNCKFDFISAGYGFLQVANMLAFLLLDPSKVALLDEPDAHLHDDLQRLIFDILKQVADSRGLQLIISTHSPTLIDAAGLESLLLIDKEEHAPLVPRNIEELIPMLTDKGMSLPPRKIMDTLKGRKVLFVEGKESDFNQFFRILGQKYDKDFLQKTRLLTIFETEGPTKRWPFDTIAAFEKLLGVEIKYVYVSDRDLNTNTQISEQIQKAKNENHSIHYLMRRNREAYLLNPILLSKLINLKWSQKGKKEISDFDSKEIKKLIVDEAREQLEDVRAAFHLFQEPYLRGPIQEKHQRLLEINNFFKESYADKVENNEIPYRLMDSKKILRKIRSYYSEKFGISFSDKELLELYSKKDIPEEIVIIIQEILKLFGE